MDIGTSTAFSADRVWLRAEGPSAGLGERQRSFLHALGRHGVVPGGAGRSSASVAQSREQEARRAAEQFVAAVFIQPVLKEVRAQNRAPAPFGPTEAEKALGPLMDAAMADRIVRAQRFGLVERIASDLARR